MRYLIVLLLFVTFAVGSATTRPTGEQYAQCSGHYFTAGVITAIDEDEENKIYYTLLSLITANKSYDIMGYVQSNTITNSVIDQYAELMSKKQDYIRPLIANIERCDKLVSRR